MLGRSIGATGIVRLNDRRVHDYAHTLVNRAILELKAANQYVSGAAYGIDTLFAEEAFAIFPQAKHVLLVPQGKWHNEELVAQFEKYAEGGFDIEIEYVYGGYMNRNTRLVERS